MVWYGIDVVWYGMVNGVLCLGWCDVHFMVCCGMVWYAGDGKVWCGIVINAMYGMVCCGWDGVMYVLWYGVVIVVWYGGMLWCGRITICCGW